MDQIAKVLNKLIIKVIINHSYISANLFSL